MAQAIRRYQDCWMPLAAKCTTGREMNHNCYLPPLDVQWVWHCHCLNPKAYQQFCKLRYSKIIDVPFFHDVSSEVSARDRCKKIWSKIYPNEPFDIDMLQSDNSDYRKIQVSQTKKTLQLEECDLIAAVSQHSSFYDQVSQPYIYQDTFLKIAKERYRCFLYMLCKLEGKVICIPTCDIHLMWQSHKASPVAYAQDTERIDGLQNDDLLIERQRDEFSQAFENTSRIWETLFGHPYERAGTIYQRVHSVKSITSSNTVPGSSLVPINGNPQGIDVNSKHKSLNSRYVVEACIQVRKTDTTVKRGDTDDIFLRLQNMQSCKILKLDAPLEECKNDIAWHKIWLMQCELSSKGLILELRSHSTGCLGACGLSKLLGRVTLTWKEIEETPLLAIDKEISFNKGSIILGDWSIGASITPPVQAPYLLRSLLDQVTDDTGAMLSKRTQQLKKQMGRWMSYTVLNHAGKECFIIRMRVATGAWRTKTERPVGVDWNERVINIHGGGWNYISGSIGIAPDKIIATATPVADELEQYKMKWLFSSGETLTIQMPIEDQEWEQHLRFTLKGSQLGMVRLLNGRHMQYQVPTAVPEEEEGFVTLVRYTPEARQGRATALFNWKLSAMEVLPEEDVVLVMLICTATLRTVSDIGGKTMDTIYRRRKARREAKERQWGSLVVAGQGGYVAAELMLWYLNAEEVLGVNMRERDYEGVIPKGGNAQMYRGTSWLYSGGTGGLYRMSSMGSCESIGSDGGGGGGHLFGVMSLPRFGSHSKTPAAAASSR